MHAAPRARARARTEARHRAMGDIEAVVAYLDFAKRELGEARVLEAVVSLAKGPFPARLEPDFLDEIPDSPEGLAISGQD